MVRGNARRSTHHVPRTTDMNPDERQRYLEHARQLFCRAGVHGVDAPVRDRAAEQLGMQHARQPHEVGIFGPAGDLVAAFETRDRLSDLRAGFAGGVSERRRHREVAIPPLSRRYASAVY